MWTVLDLWKMWLPREVNSLQKLHVDNGCDLQEKKIGYKTDMTVYLERVYRVCVRACGHMAGASCLK